MDQNEISKEIIGSAIEIHKSLGPGLLESAYKEIIVELKSIDALLSVHEAQVLTYMRFAKKKLGLLINFNARKLTDGVKRFIL